MTSHWVRAGDVLSRPVTAGSIVLRADGRVAGTLTGLDHDVWQLLAEPSTVRLLSERLGQPGRHGPIADEAAITRSLARLAASGLVAERAPDGETV